jgi:hypothetical protein
MNSRSVLYCLSVLSILTVSMTFICGCSKKEDGVTTTELIITPGVGIGTLCFGDDSSKIEALLGAPKSIEAEMYDYPGLSIHAPAGKVYQIYCGDDKKFNGEYECSCQTLEGIGIGSTEHAVIQAYGEPNAIVNDSSHYSGATQWVYREKDMVIGFVENRAYIMCFKKAINDPGQ